MKQLVLALLLLTGCKREGERREAGTQAAIVMPTDGISCEHMRTEGRFRVQFLELEAEKVFQTVSDVTCFTFAVEKGITAKVTLHPSEPIPEWTGQELFNGVVAELEKQGVSVKEEGPKRFRVSAR